MFVVISQYFSARFSHHILIKTTIEAGEISFHGLLPTKPWSLNHLVTHTSSRIGPVLLFTLQGLLPIITQMTQIANDEMDLDIADLCLHDETEVNFQVPKTTQRLDNENTSEHHPENTWSEFCKTLTSIYLHKYLPFYCQSQLTYRLL